MATGKTPTLPESIVYSNTKLNNISFTYQWKVGNFVDFLSRQYEIPSPEFIPNPTDGTMWRLVLFKKHIYPGGPHLALSLIKMSDDNIPHGVKYTISLVVDDSCNTVGTREKIFHRPLDSDDCVIMSHDELVRMKVLNHLRPNLIIRCEMDILLAENSNEDLISTQKQHRSVINNLSLPSSPLNCNPKGECVDKASNLYHSVDHDKNLAVPTAMEDEESLIALADDLERLYVEQKLTDITIVVEGRSLPAHKAVLAARSNILATSKDKDQLCITGIRSSVMEEVLHFLYSGNIKVGKFCPYLSDKETMDMLRAAVRFRIRPLEKFTERILKSNIQLRNVMDVLGLADELRLDSLKYTCLEFASHNHFDLEQTEEWQVALKKNPRIAGQVLLAIASVQALNIS